MGKFFIARDQDGKLFKYPYEEGMCASDIPHRHWRGYPFDGNYYISEDYLPRKGEELDMSLYKDVTYENSPVLFSSENPEIPLLKKVLMLGGKLYSEDDLQ